MAQSNKELKTGNNLALIIGIILLIILIAIWMAI